MIGVVVIVNPGYEILDAASFVVLGAAICFAIVHTSTKSLSSTEKPITILFFMCLVQLPIGFIFAIIDWTWPSVNQWLWIAGIGVTALSAHFCMTKAMQYAEVGTVVALDFIRLPLIAMVGVVIYGENFDIAILVGGVFMLVGNVINLYQPKNKYSQATALNTYEH